MASLIQQLGAFLWHVVDAPETAPETAATAAELAEKCVDAHNGLLDPLADQDTDAT